MAENYIQILVESLEKKVNILNQLMELNRQQEAVLMAEEFDGDAFEETIDKKSVLITDLTFIDNGFEAIYNRIKEELISHKEQHKGEIARLQELIRQVTELGMSLQASEQRNDQRLRSRFRGERQKVRQSKATVKAVTGYYQNMAGAAFAGGNILDQKK